jgi:hypothetical protein
MARAIKIFRYTKHFEGESQEEEEEEEAVQINGGDRPSRDERANIAQESADRRRRRC